MKILANSKHDNSDALLIALLQILIICISSMYSSNEVDQLYMSE